LLEMVLRQLEEEQAKATKKRDYGRVGRTGRVTKLVIRGGPPGEVRDDSKVSAASRVGSSGRVTKLAIRGGPPGKSRSHNKAGSNSGTAKTKMVMRGERPGKPRDDSKVHGDRRASKAPKDAYGKRMPPLEPLDDFHWEELDPEAKQQRRWSHWSTEAVAGNADGDANDKYACFR